MLERVWIGERVAVVHRPSMNDIAHGKLGELARKRARHIGDRDDLGRHMPRRGAREDDAADLLIECGMERVPALQAHKETDAHIALPLLSDGERLGDLRHTLYCRIDLRRADAHAARIQDRIGAAVDDEGVVLAERRVVGVVPNSGEALEISRAIAAAVVIAPEAERHGWKRRRTHELATPAADGAARGVKNLHSQPKTA